MGGLYLFGFELLKHINNFFINNVTIMGNLIVDLTQDLHAVTTDESMVFVIINFKRNLYDHYLTFMKNKALCTCGLLKCTCIYFCTYNQKCLYEIKKLLIFNFVRIFDKFKQIMLKFTNNDLVYMNKILLS